MTREERDKAIRILQWLHDNNFLFRSTEEDVKYATKLAIQELQKEPSISEDGTLTVNVEDGSKVSRVLVCGDNHFGGLYYPEQETVTEFADRCRECGERYGKLLKEKTGRWIPVSERLPEEGICDDGYVEPSDYVLVWGDHGNYGVSRYWGNRKTKTENPNSYKDWMDLEWVVQKPIAWMPLPQPYKAESEGKECGKQY